MASKINALPPSLTGELQDLKNRLTSLERRPTPVARFDRYPVAEWKAVSRDKVGGNQWSSCGIANVTGLVYDRLEVKFITDYILKGKREAEMRLAAFRHYGNASKECVSASQAFRLHGNATRNLGTGVFRWKHGIPFGWDYENGEATYTVELQHRYLVGPEDTKGTSLFGIQAPEGSSTAGLTNRGTVQEDGKWWWSPEYYETSKYSGGYITIPNSDNGNYAISTMQYCVGLPEDRIAINGNIWAWYIGGEVSWGDPGNVDDPTF